MTYSLNTEARAGPDVPTSTTLDIPPVDPAERTNFDVRTFMQRWGLDIIPGGGAHMWREVWNSRVSKIYINVLSKFFPSSIHFSDDCSYICCRGAGTTFRQATKGGSLSRIQAKEALYLIYLCFVIFTLSFLIEVTPVQVLSIQLSIA